MPIWKTIPLRLIALAQRYPGTIAAFGFAVNEGNDGETLPRGFKSSGQIIKGEVRHNEIAADSGVLWPHGAFRGASPVPLAA